MIAHSWDFFSWKDKIQLDPAKKNFLVPSSQLHGFTGRVRKKTEILKFYTDNPY